MGMKNATMMAEHSEEASERKQLPEDYGRQRRWRVAAVAVVLACVTVGLWTRSGDGRTGGRVKVLAYPMPSTTATEAPAMTAVVAPATTAPVAPSVGPDPAPTTTAAAKPTTTVPRPAAVPDRSRPAGMTYTPESIWPETLTELDRLQAAVDQGQQPWRTDPVSVARAYLLDRGLPTPGVGPFEATSAAAGRVNYTVAGRGGSVHLQRLNNGSIWYVAHSRTATLPGVKVSRQGTSLAVVVQGGADATLTARAKRPGGAWAAEQGAQLFNGGTRSMTVATGQTSGEMILQLRVQGDGKAGLAELFLSAGSDGAGYSVLNTESRLQVDGLGPVRIGMDLEGAVATTGLAMSYNEGPYCVGYATTGPPAGISLISVAGSFKVDFINISEPTISTVSGIRVGSTLAEVRRAYGDKLRGSVQDGRGRLVFRSGDASLNHLSLALHLSDGIVTEMSAGLRGPVEADEACA